MNAHFIKEAVTGIKISTLDYLLIKEQGECWD
jgi:hypothetical protein